MSFRVRVALSALLALAALVAPLTVAGAGVAAPTGAASAQQSTPTPDLATEETVIRIELHGDGDATWTITTRLDVSSSEDRAAYDELADRYESGESPAPWLDSVYEFNESAEEATGRSMEITDVERSTDRENATVSLQFHWSNFSRQDGEYLVARDAFNTTDGTWLGGLADHQVLILELPENPVVRSSPRAVDNGEIRWEGPHEFEPGHPYVEFRASDRAGGPDTVTTTAPDDQNASLLWAGFFALGIGIVAVGAYVISQRRGGLPAPGGSDPDTPGSASPAAPADGAGEPQPASTGTVEPAPEPTGDEDSVDEELLSDEERVERLLDRNGGRMKQANIVKETGWSNAKVSQLLSSMEDEGRIDKLRIGRENLISYPDEDVADVDDT